MNHCMGGLENFDIAAHAGHGEGTGKDTGMQPVRVGT